MSRPWHDENSTVAKVTRLLARFPEEPKIERVELHPLALSRFNKEWYGNYDVRRLPPHPDYPIELRARLRARGRRMFKYEAWVYFKDGDKIETELER